MFSLGLIGFVFTHGILHPFVLLLHKKIVVSSIVSELLVLELDCVLI